MHYTLGILLQEINDNGTLILVLVAVTILLLLLVVVVVLFSVFMKRKNGLLIEQQEAQKRYEKELAETQIEIREETLRNISWELHDNIGQLLTLAKIQTQNSSGKPAAINDAVNTIASALTELRALSKLINPEALKNLSLPEAIQLELDRFNRMNYLNATLNIKGIPLDIENKIQVILFRILQEFFTNTIKHAKATTLEVTLNYSKDTLSINAQDNGIGFDYGKAVAKNGIGLSNIETRAQLIQAKASYTSQPNKGTSLSLIYTP